MGLLRRLADAFDPIAEHRAVSSRDPYLAHLFGGIDTTAGKLVNARTAENLSTVLACVGAIAAGIACLPAYIYRTSDGRRETIADHPLAVLIRQGVNPHQTWADWLEWLVASTLLRGNGLSEIVADNRGAVQELRPVPWDHVGVQLLPNRRMVYDVSEITTIYGGTGRARRLLQSEVLHVRDRSDDGLIGRSRLHRAAEVISSGLAVQEFAGSMYANQATPSGILEAEGKIGEESLKRLATHFREAFAGARNARKSLILDQGLKWKSIQVSPEDAELLASRRFTTEELARLFQVPPPIVGIWDHSSFTNSETAGRWFAQFTLGPWIRKIEAEIGRALLSDGFEIELDLSGFLRGDPEQRWKAHEIAVKNRILTPNEIRLSEGWNKRDGGDEFPSAPVPAEAPAMGAA